MSLLEGDEQPTEIDRSSKTKSRNSLASAIASRGSFLANAISKHLKRISESLMRDDLRRSLG